MNAREIFTNRAVGIVRLIEKVQFYCFRAVFHYSSPNHQLAMFEKFFFLNSLKFV